MRTSVVRTLRAIHVLVFLSVPVFAQRSPGTEFIFHKVDPGSWQGSCDPSSELFGTATFTIARTTSIASDMWRKDLTPEAVWAGVETDSDYADSTIEIELYTGGFGVLRTQDGWFAVAGVAASEDTVRFQVDTSCEVKPSGLDREIIQRAAAMLNAETVWNRADNRRCNPHATTWSIYCAMELATVQVTGAFHHRRPALQLVRRIVNERAAGRAYHHRLMEYNNDPTTTFHNVQDIFASALASVSPRKKSRQFAHGPAELALLMALRRLPFKRLQHLIDVHLSTQEWPETRRVIGELQDARRRGYLTRAELITVCRWKSPRAIRHIRRNRSATIRSITKEAFSTRSEQLKLSLLTHLHGVSVPMASAILTLTHPRRYGVIDIRVWQVLHAIGTVDSNATGVGFTFRHWYRYLTILRHFAHRYNVSARDIERTLFTVHELYQKETLYRK